MRAVGLRRLRRLVRGAAPHGSALARSLIDPHPGSLATGPTLLLGAPSTTRANGDEMRVRTRRGFGLVVACRAERGSLAPAGVTPTPRPHCARRGRLQWPQRGRGHCAATSNAGVHERTIEIVAWRSSGISSARDRPVAKGVARSPPAGARKRLSGIGAAGRNISPLRWGFDRGPQAPGLWTGRPAVGW